MGETFQRCQHSKELRWSERKLLHQILFEKLSPNKRGLWEKKSTREQSKEISSYYSVLQTCKKLSSNLPVVFQLLQRQRQSLFHALQHCIIWHLWPFWSLGFERDEEGCFRGTLFPLWSLLLYSIPSDSNWSFSSSVVLAPGPDQVSILISRIWETFLGGGETLASLPLNLGPRATAWDCLRASLLHQAAQPFPYACFCHMSGAYNRWGGSSEIVTQQYCKDSGHRDCLFETQSHMGSISVF